MLPGKADGCFVELCRTVAVDEALMSLAVDIKPR